MDMVGREGFFFFFFFALLALFFFCNRFGDAVFRMIQ